MSKLKEEELLKHLDRMRQAWKMDMLPLIDYNPKVEEQAYQQIKEMIQNQSDSEQRIAKLGIELSECYEIQEKLRKRIQKKPEVTEELIEEKKREMIKILGMAKVHTESRNFIRKLVEAMPVKRVTVSEELVEEESYCLEWKDKDELRNELIPKMLKKAGVEVVEK